MDIAISFDVTSGADFQPEIDDLQNLLTETGLSVEEIKGDSPPGNKSEVVVALQVAGIALQSILVLVNCLSYWRSTRSSCSVTLRVGDVQLSDDNLTPAAAFQRMQELKLACESDDAVVTVSCK